MFEITEVRNLMPLGLFRGNGKVAIKNSRRWKMRSLFLSRDRAAKLECWAQRCVIASKSPLIGTFRHGIRFAVYPGEVG